ncbi:pentatricopeptide repeat-containing protein [Tanacetum coccineum]
MYMKLGFLDSALKVFDGMSERNVNLFNVVVSGFCLNGYLKRGFGVFRRFGEFGVRPDSVTVSSLLSGCGGDVRVGGLVHCWGVKIGVEECNCDDDVEFLAEYWCFEGECGGGGGNCHCFR